MLTPFRDFGDIYEPTTLLGGTSIGEREYRRRIKEAHVTLKGTSVVKADLMFVNVASQKVQGYGCLKNSKTVVTFVFLTV